MTYREKPSTFDRLLAKNPPRIRWRKNHRGVLVAVDPPTHVADEAAWEPVERPRETPLLAAARTEI